MLPFGELITRPVLPFHRREGAQRDLYSDRAYFFDHGLLFECLRCGACCTGDPGTVYVAPEELIPMAEHLHLNIPELIRSFLYPYRDSYSIREDEHGNCLFFNKGCTLYAVRPLQCRTFPFWFANLRSLSRWQQVQRQCPGIGHGRRYSRAEIMDLARKTMTI